MLNKHFNNSINNESISAYYTDQPAVESTSEYYQETIKKENNSNFILEKSVTTFKQTSRNSIETISGVKLDPSILKYVNQPIAVVAPNKSNSNTLEKKKIKTEEYNFFLLFKTMSI